MGMYDTIIDDQVKCFNWVSLYHDELTYHGGDLKYYGVGDEVPYCKPHYNYGKNFLILDVNESYDPNDLFLSDYQFVIYVIRDGKVVCNYHDTIGYIDFSVNDTVVDYHGTLLNLHSADDVNAYILALREYKRRYKKLNKECDEIFHKWSHAISGIGSLPVNSEERITKMKNAKMFKLQLDEAREKIAPDIERINAELNVWYTDMSELKDVILLGEYISASELSYPNEDDTRKGILDAIHKMLADDPTLYDRYVKWQGSDQFISQLPTT